MSSSQSVVIGAARWLTSERVTRDIYQRELLGCVGVREVPNALQCLAQFLNFRDGVVADNIYKIKVPDEEGLVEILDTALAQVLKDNKTMWRTLLRALK